jgi:hypothetical protein
VSAILQQSSSLSAEARRERISYPAAMQILGAITPRTTILPDISVPQIQRQEVSLSYLWPHNKVGLKKQFQVHYLFLNQQKRRRFFIVFFLSFLF